MKYLYILIIFLFLTACSYSFYLNSLPHLKDVQIKAFENSTAEYLLSEELLDYLSESFGSDNRLKVVNKNPDCIIEGKILDYSDDPDKYDMEENIQERKVSILFAIKFIDMENGKEIWSNDRLVITKSYISDGAADDSDKPIDESEACEAIFEDLFDKLIKNTLEAW